MPRTKNCQEFFVKDPRLPFVECRYSKASTRTFKEHIHQNFSIGAVLHGKVVFSIDGHEVLLERGSLALINPETLHSCNAHTAEPRDYCMLHLDLDWCTKVQQSLWAVDSFQRAVSIKILNQRLYTRFCRMVHLMIDGKTSLLHKEQCLLDVVGNLFRKICLPQRPRREAADISQLRELLKQNLAEDLSLSMLADRLKSNPFTLLRRFKSATGITPHAYRTNCRVEMARILLQQGGDIAEVALECGFFDQSHLHRHFKAITTVTPLEYRVNFIQ